MPEPAQILPFSSRDEPIVLDDDDEDVQMAPAAQPSARSPSASLRDMTPAVSVSTSSSDGNAHTNGLAANGTNLASQIGSLSSSSSFDQYRTGYVFSSEMTLHTNPIDPEHPEKPLRIWRIYQQFQANRLFQRMKRIQIREVTEDEVKLVHDQGIWNGVFASACKLSSITIPSMFT